MKRFFSGFTTFGDDIVPSDYLFSKSDNDRFICLEGGAQSFKQATNALTLGIPLIMVYNIRKPENEKFFSATRFFKLISDEYKKGQTPTKDRIREIYNSYVKTLVSLWDTKKPDFETKKALFEKGMEEFIAEGLFERVPALCSFRDAKIDKP